MNIVFCTDTKYVMPSGVLMKSICVNNTAEDIAFYAIIDESVTEEDKQALRGVLSASNHNIDFFMVHGKDYEGYPNLDVSPEYAAKMHITATHTTKACYYRLSMANLLPQTVDRVLYFDCDVVVTGSLKKLWEKPLDGHAVAAVKDEGEASMDYMTLGYPQVDGYFNSGVMIIDLKRWREEGWFAKFLQIIEEHRGEMRQHDQEILNIAFHNDVKLLEIKYNLQENFLRKPEYIPYLWSMYGNEIKDALSNYVCIHFTAYKPWVGECKQPLKKEFFKYLKMTRWRGYKVRWKNSLKVRWHITVYNWLVKLGVLKSMYVKIKERA